MADQAEQAAGALAALQRLAGTLGWAPSVVTDDLMLVQRLHGDGTTDTLALRSGSAQAERTRPDDQPVWRDGPGPVAEVITAMLDLPEPGAPGAPAAVLGGGTASQLWAL